MVAMLVSIISDALETPLDNTSAQNIMLSAP